MEFVSVFGITPEEKYAVAASNGKGYYLGYLKEQELMNYRIKEIQFTTGEIDIQNLPVNIQKSIFFMMKPFFPLVSGAPMVSDVLDVDDVGGRIVIGVSYMEYPLTYGEYLASGDLNISNVSHLLAERKEVVVSILQQSYLDLLSDDEIESLFNPNSMLTNRATPFEWTSLSESSVDTMLDLTDPSSKECFKKFREFYDVQYLHLGYPEDCPIPSFLGTGTTLERFANPRNGSSFFKEYGVANPREIVNAKFMDHVTCFKCKNGKVLLTTQPYLRDSEIRDLWNKMADNPCVPLVYKAIKLDILGKDSSWHNKGNTNLVVLSLEGKS